ncbi:hypothetical protein HY404_02050 [Candidatus Microgenomates bacterium]|nr:hypothetical protein [Candidatus Microgenomates bacterium]
MVVNSKQGGFTPILILIIVVILAIGGGAYFLGKQSITLTPRESMNTVLPSPTSLDETASWKTYTNSRYKFSIQYPLTYSLADTTGGGSMVVISNAGIPEKPTLIIEKFMGGHGINVITGEIKVVLSNNQLKINKITKISDEEYKKLVNNTEDEMARINDGHQDFMSNMIEKDGDEFIFYLRYEGPNQSIEDELFKILSTFKFTQ